MNTNAALPPAFLLILSLVIYGLLTNSVNVNRGLFGWGSWKQYREPDASDWQF